MHLIHPEPCERHLAQEIAALYNREAKLQGRHTYQVASFRVGPFDSHHLKAVAETLESYRSVIALLKDELAKAHAVPPPTLAIESPLCQWQQS